MTFVRNDVAPTTATLYVAMQPNGVGGPPTINRHWLLGCRYFQ